MLRVVIVLAVHTLAPAPFAWSSEQSVSDVPVTVHEAVELAIKNRDEIRMEDVQAAIQQARVKEAKSAFFPTLSLLGSVEYEKAYDIFSGVEATARIGDVEYIVRVDKVVPPYQVNAGAELNYNLYAGGRDIALVKEASAKRVAAEYQKIVAFRKVVLDVTTAYWELRKAQVAYGIAERWRQYHLTSSNIAEEQRRAGRISEIDRKAENLKLQEQEINAAQAKRELMSSLRKYRRALGLSDKETGGNEEHIPELTDDPNQEISLPEPARQQHPELSKIEAEIQAAKAYARAIRAEYLPSIDFFANYAGIGRDFDSFSNAFDEVHRNYYIIGLRLKVNFFEGFKTHHKAQRAHLEARLAELHLEQKRKELSDTVQEKNLRLEKAMDDLSLAQERSRVSEAKEEIARVQHRIGKYSEQEYRKERITAQEDADKVRMAMIDVALARLNLLLVSLN